MRDGTPEIDDLEAMLEELGDVRGRKALVHEGDGPFCGLVNVHSDDGLAGLRCFSESWVTPADDWESRIVS